MVVDNGHVGRRQPGDRRRGQVDDGADLARGERCPGREVHEDGRGRGLLRPHREFTLLRDHEVDLGRLHPLNGGDGLFELSFERLLVLHLLDEIGRGDATLLQIGEPDIAGLREALLRQGDPFLVDIGRGHEDRRPPVCELVRDLLAGQLLGDRPGVRRLEVGEQRLVARLGLSAHEHHSGDDGAHDSQDGHHLLAGGEAGEDRGGAPARRGQGIAGDRDQRHRQAVMSMMELKASTALSRTDVTNCVSRSAFVEATVTSAMLALPVAACSDRLVAACCDESSESMALPSTSENEDDDVPVAASAAPVPEAAAPEAAAPDAALDAADAACEVPAAIAELMEGMAGITSGLDAQDGLVCARRMRHDG